MACERQDCSQHGAHRQRDIFAARHRTDSGREYWHHVSDARDSQFQVAYDGREYNADSRWFGLAIVILRKRSVTVCEARMSEASEIKIQQTTVESLGTSVQVRLQVVYTTTNTPESVELSVVLPDTDRSLSEIQQDALDRAKLILDLWSATRRAPEQSEGENPETKDLWARLRP